MGLIEDAQLLELQTPTYGHPISRYICPIMIEHHEDCVYCDAPLMGPHREPLGDPQPDCPWLSMPRVVQALEAAQRVAAIYRDLRDHEGRMDHSVDEWEALAALNDVMEEAHRSDERA